MVRAFPPGHQEVRVRVPSDARVLIGPNIVVKACSLDTSRLRPKETDLNKFYEVFVVHDGDPPSLQYSVDLPMYTFPSFKRGGKKLLFSLSLISGLVSPSFVRKLAHVIARLYAYISNQSLFSQIFHLQWRQNI